MIRSALALGLFLFFIGCSNAPEKPSPKPLKRTAELVGLDEIESVALGGGDRTGLMPAFKDGLIAAASASGDVYAFDTELNELWSIDLNRPVLAGVGISKTAVYVITEDATLVALSLADGDVIFEVPLPSNALVPPIATESLVFVKTQIGRLLALNPQTGRTVWIEEAQEPGIGIRGGSPMTLSGNTLFVLWESGRLIAYQIQTGRILWERQVAVARGRSPLERIVDSKGAPSVRNSLVATSTRNGQVSLRDSTSGQLIWSFDADAYPGTLLAFNAVTVIETDGTVSSFSTSSGELLWTTEELQYRELSPPSVIGDFIGVMDFEGKLHLLDPANGFIVGRLNVGSSKGIVAPLGIKKGALIQLVDGNLSLVELVP